MKTTTLKMILASTLSASLVGCSKPAATETSQSNAAVPADNGKVSVTVNEHGFSPSSIKANKGEPLTVEFTRTSDRTCAKSVVFPEINLTQDLPLNAAVAVRVPTDQARTLTFQCGMGMYKSSVVVM